MKGIRFGIDLRFYSNRPYGLAIHIKNLLTYLLPILKEDNNFSEVYLIFNKELENEFKENLPSFLVETRRSDKFKIVYSKAGYYSIKEQTSFLVQLNSLKLDLTYFFTFNFPIFYRNKFLYQVLDISQIKIAKSKEASFSYKLKALVAELILRTGIKKSAKTLLLGNQTKNDIKNLLNINLDQGKNPNKVIWNGVSKIYIDSNYTSPNKQEIIEKGGLKISVKGIDEAKKFRQKNNINKDYFLFVSALKKHKNIARLVKSFEKIQVEYNSKYQLVIVGNTDKKNQGEIGVMRNSPEFKKGNILHLTNLSDQELIYLQDSSLAYLMPSMSEGFGLTIAEAANRFTPVICSNIEVFQEILKDTAYYFDPENIESITKLIKEFLESKEAEINTKISAARKIVSKYNWQDVAQDIYLEISSLI
jgi:glycosyltransferase involved in cell wall biosynthesis